jgi:hypothetical protein
MKSNSRVSILRRRFLATLAVISGGLLVRKTLPADTTDKPREIPLHEADYYGPHNLKG